VWASVRRSPHLYSTQPFPGENHEILRHEQFARADNHVFGENPFVPQLFSPLGYITIERLRRILLDPFYERDYRVAATAESSAWVTLAEYA
jgi:hypothetical protein